MVDVEPGVRASRIRLGHIVAEQLTRAKARGAVMSMMGQLDALKDDVAKIGHKEALGAVEDAYVAVSRVRRWLDRLTDWERDIG